MTLRHINSRKKQKALEESAKMYAFLYAAFLSHPETPKTKFFADTKRLMAKAQPSLNFDRKEVWDEILKKADRYLD